MSFHQLLLNIREVRTRKIEGFKMKFNKKTENESL
jgi:hypothetical protein